MLQIANNYGSVINSEISLSHESFMDASALGILNGIASSTCALLIVDLHTGGMLTAITFMATAVGAIAGKAAATKLNNITDDYNCFNLNSNEDFAPGFSGSICFNNDFEK